MTALSQGYCIFIPLCNRFATALSYGAFAASLPASWRQRAEPEQAGSMASDPDDPGRPAPRGAPLLADVARLAGVSEITASRVVRGTGRVSAATRARVMAAVEAVGYVPNRLAGALASSGSMLVGVVLPSLANIVFAEVLRGIHAGLAGSGFQPVVGVSDYDPAAEESVVRAMMAWQPRAMIVAGFEHTAPARDLLAAGGLRVAEIMDIDTAPLDVAVGLSHDRAGAATAQHLLAKGYRRFGYVGHDWARDVRARRRFEGARRVLAAEGLDFVAVRRAEGPSTVQAGRAMLAALLAGGGEPDVVMFSNDDMAVGGVFHCMAAGLEPGRDLGLFGFNGLEIGDALPRRLSTVRSNRFLIGRSAAEAIIAAPRRPAAVQVIDTGFTIEPGETA